MADLINEVFGLPGDRMTARDWIIGVCACGGFFAFVWSFKLLAVGFGLGA